MKTVAIVQARMGSTRLPGKVLMDLAGEPMLSRVVNRLQRARTLATVIIATTTQSTDDVVGAFCASRGWNCFRGSVNDVLDRYYHAARTYSADVIVRITADCPLIDPDVVDWVVRDYIARQPGVDYVANVLPPRSFPRGLDTEVFSFSALEQAWREDDNPAWREHVTPYFYRHLNKFRVSSVTNEEDLSWMRWTVDTPEDWELMMRIYEYFGHDRFSWLDVIGLLKSQPEWFEINRQVKQKDV